MRNRRGIGHGAGARMRNIAYRGIIGEGIAVIAVELAARGTIVAQALRLNPAALVAAASSPDAEAADIAILVERRVIGEAGRIGPVAAHPDEQPVQIGRDRPQDLALGNVGLEPLRRKKTVLFGAPRQSHQ
jgi:hypothetical protein